MGIFSTIKKELLEISHDQTMMLVLLVFPIFIMIFMGSSFRSLEINGLPIGVAGPLNTTFSSMLLSGLDESKAFNLQSFDSEEEALGAFKNGRLRAVIVIPQDFEETLLSGNGSTIRIIVDNSDLALEQAIVGAMSAVVQASSADITKTYVVAAWEDLYALNDSASVLASDIGRSRAKMQDTRAQLIVIRQNLSDLDIGALESSLNRASSKTGELQLLLTEQRAALANFSEENERLFNESEMFLYNASFALNESIATVESTHNQLVNQTVELNRTAATLNTSIAGLRAVRSSVVNSSCNITIPAIDLTITSLETLRDNAQQQLVDAQEEITQLEELNSTLRQFGYSLQNYSLRLAEARTNLGHAESMREALDNASTALSELNSTFDGARTDVARLRALLSTIGSTTEDIEGTLDEALAQTSSVDSLITSLQQMVERQTSRDPERLASPLSVELENQYVRTSAVDFILPQVMSVSLLFSCFLLASISLVREKTRNTISRALMAPGGLRNLVFGKILSMVILTFIQVALILMVALLLFGVQPPENLGVLIWGTAISSLVLSSIGVLVGFYARSESAAIQGCLLLAIPMLFLGNIIFSPDLLPQYTQILLQLLPLAHVTSIYKIVLITNGDPAYDIAALLSYFLLLAILLAYVLIKRRDISNYR